MAQKQISKQTSHQEFVHLARIAANAELHGEIQQAATYWRKAAMCARNELNQCWAEARQLFCEKQIKRCPSTTTPSGNVVL